MNKKVVTITNLIILICSFILINQILSNQISQADYYRLGAFQKAAVIYRKEYYRLVTSGLLHADLMHLLFNMYMLYQVGNNLELAAGKILLVLVFFGSIIGGNVLTLIFDPNYTILGVGASGGIFGVIGFLILYYKSISQVQSKSLKRLVFINLIYGFMMPGIGNLAHIGGLITGVIIGVFYKRTRT